MKGLYLGGCGSEDDHSGLQNGIGWWEVRGGSPKTSSRPVVAFYFQQVKEERA